MHRLLVRIAFAGCWSVSFPLFSSAADVPLDGSAQAVDVMQQTDAAFRQVARRSSDPRLGILYAQLAEPDDKPVLAELIERMRGSSDPLAFELLMARCRSGERSPPSTCDAVDLARRWTVADTQNVVPWIVLAAALENVGDQAGADDAWVRAGRASQFRGSTSAVARLVFAQLPRDDDARVRYAHASYAIGVAAAVPAVWLVAARRGCKSAARRDTCAHIADVIDRDADTIVDLQAAAALSTQAQQPDWIRAGRRQAGEALQWALLDSTADDGAIDAMDPRELAALDDRLERIIARGDATLARDALRARGLSAAQGSARYASYMGALMNRLHPN